MMRLGQELTYLFITMGRHYKRLSPWPQEAGMPNKMHEPNESNKEMPAVDDVGRLRHGWRDPSWKVLVCRTSWRFTAPRRSKV
jgi:hypothetical protein